MLNQDFLGSKDNTQEVKEDATRNQARTWEKFSNHTAGGDGGVISIESWHDDIHDLIKGHMGNSAVAAVCFFVSTLCMHITNFVGSLTLYFGSIIGKYPCW